MVFGTRVLKYWVLGPSGWYQPTGTLSQIFFNECRLCEALALPRNSRPGASSLHCQRSWQVGPRKAHHGVYPNTLVVFLLRIRQARGRLSETLEVWTLRFVNSVIRGPKHSFIPGFLRSLEPKVPNLRVWTCRF